jgi:hypothetical protein
MDYIFDELQRNDIAIDMHTLSYHIKYMIQRHDRVYNDVMVHVNHDNILEIFSKINVNNFGRAMAYLAVVYLMKESEEVTHEAVRPAIPFLKNIDCSAYRVEGSFFHRLRFYIACVFSLG